jgi:hypothetical protein
MRQKPLNSKLLTWTALLITSTHLSVGCATNTPETSATPNPTKAAQKATDTKGDQKKSNSKLKGLGGKETPENEEDKKTGDDANRKSKNKDTKKTATVTDELPLASFHKDFAKLIDKEFEVLPKTTTVETVLKILIADKRTSAPHKKWFKTALELSAPEQLKKKATSQSTLETLFLVAPLQYISMSLEDLELGDKDEATPKEASKAAPKNLAQRIASLDILKSEQKAALFKIFDELELNRYSGNSDHKISQKEIIQLSIAMIKRGTVAMSKSAPADGDDKKIDDAATTSPTIPAKSFSKIDWDEIIRLANDVLGTDEASPSTAPEKQPKKPDSNLEKFPSRDKPGPAVPTEDPALTAPKKARTPEVPAEDPALTAPKKIPAADKEPKPEAVKKASKKQAAEVSGKKTPATSKSKPTIESVTIPIAAWMSPSPLAYPLSKLVILSNSSGTLRSFKVQDEEVMLADLTTDHGKDFKFKNDFGKEVSINVKLSAIDDITYFVTIKQGSLTAEAQLINDSKKWNLHKSDKGDHSKVAQIILYFEDTASLLASQVSSIMLQKSNEALVKKN